jgi:pseudouridine synthase
MARVRLQKVMAAAGFGSRRACEELILEGRVTVNGRVHAELPVLVDPDSDDIRVGGKRARSQPLIYYLLHKPKGVVCTQRDPEGRTRAVDLVPETRYRLFPVGRLDMDSTGLVLLTTDGALAQRLTHPRYGVPRTYLAEVRGRMTPETLEELKEGVWLSDGKTSKSRLKLVRKGRDRSVVEITIREGRNRQVRRVFARVGHPVRKLTRVTMGPMRLGRLKPGKWRKLSDIEVRKLRGLSTNSRKGS